MKITLFQQNIVWANPAENRERIDALLEGRASAEGKSDLSAVPQGTDQCAVLQGTGQCAEPQERDSLAIPPDTDLLVLPEMFSTGFATEPEGIAERCEEGRFASLDWMRERASRYGFAIAGSIAVEENGRYYNRFTFVKPDGESAFYNKHHLFTYGKEDKHFTAGAEHLLIDYRGVRIMPLICYDLRFPLWSRNHGEYDLLIYVASWPTSRVEAWRTLLKARAIENQCYVVGVNRVGEDPSCSYCGGSAVIDPYGRVMAECRDGQEELLSVEIDLEVLKEFRKKFPVLGDADIF